MSDFSAGGGTPPPSPSTKNSLYMYIYITFIYIIHMHIQKNFAKRLLYTIKKLHVHHIHQVPKWPSYICKICALFVSQIYMVYIYIYIFACLFSVRNTINLSHHVSSGPMMGEVSLETVSVNILVHDVINLLYK